MTTKEMSGSLSGARERSTKKQSTAPRRPSAQDIPVRYHLKLYVAGQTPKAIRALANLKAFCDKHLPHGYGIEVIDLVEKPHLARSDNIVAIPTVVRVLPPPPHRTIGDLSDEHRVLARLVLKEE